MWEFDENSFVDNPGRLLRVGSDRPIIVRVRPNGIRQGGIVHAGVSLGKGYGWSDVYDVRLEKRESGYLEALLRPGTNSITFHWQADGIDQWENISFYIKTFDPEFFELERLVGSLHANKPDVPADTLEGLIKMHRMFLAYKEMLTLYGRQTRMRVKELLERISRGDIGGFLMEEARYLTALMPNPHHIDDFGTLSWYRWFDVGEGKEYGGCAIAEGCRRPCRHCARNNRIPVSRNMPLPLAVKRAGYTSSGWYYRNDVCDWSDPFFGVYLDGLLEYNLRALPGNQYNFLTRGWFKEDFRIQRSMERVAKLPLPDNYSGFILAFHLAWPDPDVILAIRDSVGGRETELAVEKYAERYANIIRTLGPALRNITVYLDNTNKIYNDLTIRAFLRSLDMCGIGHGGVLDFLRDNYNANGIKYHRISEGAFSFKININKILAIGKGGRFLKETEEADHPSNMPVSLGTGSYNDPQLERIYSCETLDLDDTVMPFRDYPQAMIGGDGTVTVFSVNNYGKILFESTLDELYPVIKKANAISTDAGIIGRSSVNSRPLNTKKWKPNEPHHFAKDPNSVPRPNPGEIFPLSSEPLPRMTPRKADSSVENMAGGSSAKTQNGLSPETVKEHREALGITLADISAETGISPASINRYERGVRDAQDSTLSLIYEAVDRVRARQFRQLREMARLTTQELAASVGMEKDRLEKIEKNEVIADHSLWKRLDEKAGELSRMRLKSRRLAARMTQKELALLSALRPADIVGFEADVSISEMNLAILHQAIDKFQGGRLRLGLESARLNKEEVASEAILAPGLLERLMKGEESDNIGALERAHEAINRLQGKRLRERRQAARLSMDTIQSKAKTLRKYITKLEFGRFDKYSPRNFEKIPARLRKLHSAIDKLQCEYLIKRRKAARLTHSEVAFAMGSTVSHIKRVESGESITGPDIVKKVHAAIDRLQGVKLKELRMAKGLTQEELAGLSGVDLWIIKKMERIKQDNIKEKTLLIRDDNTDLLSRLHEAIESAESKSSAELRDSTIRLAVKMIKRRWDKTRIGDGDDFMIIGIKGLRNALQKRSQVPISLETMRQYLKRPEFSSYLEREGLEWVWRDKKHTEFSVLPLFGSEISGGSSSDFDPESVLEAYPEFIDRPEKFVVYIETNYPGELDKVPHQERRRYAESLIDSYVRRVEQREIEQNEGAIHGGSKKPWHSKRVDPLLLVREKIIRTIKESGLTYKELAARLGVSAPTVASIVKRIARKLNTNTRQALSSYFSLPKSFFEFSPPQGDFDLSIWEITDIINAARQMAQRKAMDEAYKHISEAKKKFGALSDAWQEDESKAILLSTIYIDLLAAEKEIALPPRSVPNRSASIDASGLGHARRNKLNIGDIAPGNTSASGMKLEQDALRAEEGARPNSKKFMTPPEDRRERPVNLGNEQEEIISWEFVPNDESALEEFSRSLDGALSIRGWDGANKQRILISCGELVLNMIRHGLGGDITIYSEKTKEGRDSIIAKCRDNGPGIDNPDILLQESIERQRKAAEYRRKMTGEVPPLNGYGFSEMIFHCDDAIIQSKGIRWVKRGHLINNLALLSQGAVDSDLAIGTRIMLSWFKQSEARAEASMSIEFNDYKTSIGVRNETVSNVTSDAGGAAIATDEYVVDMPLRYGKPIWFTPSHELKLKESMELLMPAIKDIVGTLFVRNMTLYHKLYGFFGRVQPHSIAKIWKEADAIERTQAFDWTKLRYDWSIVILGRSLYCRDYYYGRANWEEEEHPVFNISFKGTVLPYEKYCRIKDQIVLTIKQLYGNDKKYYKRYRFLEGHLFDSLAAELGIDSVELSDQIGIKNPRAILSISIVNKDKAPQQEINSDDTTIASQSAPNHLAYIDASGSGHARRTGPIAPEDPLRGDGGKRGFMKDADEPNVLPDENGTANPTGLQLRPQSDEPSPAAKPVETATGGSMDSGSLRTVPNLPGDDAGEISR
ncbi:MAG: helix-turn-helix domain-containing protein, partial [Candidatus Omnitrophota bacterium]